MFISYLMMIFDAVLSNFRSSSTVIRESDDIPIVPKALMDKLTNVTLEYASERSDIRELYFVLLQSLLICILDSNPTINSMI